ncbi:MAG: CBS domain-containing protein [Gammaproteobacteria bacterium]|nr:CBS domain-containing protein [Gammaproteobacteria bacterium]
MAKDYSILLTHSLNQCNHFIAPKQLPELVHLDDPAFDAMINFEHVKPLSIEQDRRMNDARVEMENSLLHVMLVTDETDCLIGIITLTDILGAKPVKLQETLRIERKKIKIKHIMTPIKDLVAIDYDNLLPAKIGHVVSTLLSLKQHYALVSQTNADSGEQVIKGLFLDSEISKQLGINIHSQPILSLTELQYKLST